MITTFPPDKYDCELIEPATNPALNYAQRHWGDDYAKDFFIDNDLIAQYDEMRHATQPGGATLPDA